MLLAWGLLVIHETSHNLSQVELWAAIGAVVGTVLFVRGFKMLRFKRLILNTPASKIRSASMGLVELAGAAKGPATIPAGITGEPCFYYRAVIWQLRQSGKNREWQQVACESLYVPFFVEDSTGRMLVDPQNADLDIHRNFKDEYDRSFFSANRNVLPENVAGFLARNGISFDDSTRVEEYCIKPDNPLFVFGTLEQNSNHVSWTAGAHIRAGTSFHANLSLLGAGSGLFRTFGIASSGINVTFSKSPNSTAYRPTVTEVVSGLKRAMAPGSAAPSAWSEVSMDEVALSRKAAAPSAVATAEPDPRPAASSPAAAPNCDFDSNPSACVGSGSNKDPFMISWRSQREVVQSLAWKSALCIWGGPVLTTASLYILALCFGWT